MEEQRIFVTVRKAPGAFAMTFLLFVLVVFVVHLAKNGLLIPIVLGIAAAYGLAALARHRTREEQRQSALYHQEKARQRRLAEDADREHTAMMRGDTQTGTFGRFPPAV